MSFHTNQKLFAMIGPTRPGAASTSSQSSVAAGPSLPAHLQNRHGGQISEAAPEEDDEDDDGYTPALPPSMASRAQGPSLPPHLAGQPSTQPDSSDSGSDDDVGPRPPPAAGSGPILTAGEEFRLREKQKQDEEAERKRLEGLKPKREEWMLVPPSSLDMMASTDPTKLKTRGFAQNTRRGGAAGGKASDEGIALWTETPEERAKRQDEEVLGKRKRVENAAKQETDAERAARLVRQNRDAEMRSQVEAYNVGDGVDPA